MATVYVSNAAVNGYAIGNDANSYAQAQSKATPWLTVTYACQNCANNDTIVINDGTYSEASITPSKTGLTINSETDYGAHLVCSGGGIYWNSATGSTTWGRVWINANGQNYGILGKSTATVLTLNQTKITNYVVAAVHTGSAPIALTLNQPIFSTAVSLSYGLYIHPTAGTGDATVIWNGGSISHIFAAGSGAPLLVDFQPTTATAGSSFTMTGVTVSVTITGGTNVVTTAFIKGVKTVSITNNTVNIAGSVNGHKVYQIPNAALPCTSLTISGNTVNCGDSDVATFTTSTFALVGTYPSGATDNSITGVSIYDNTFTDTKTGIEFCCITGAEANNNKGYTTCAPYVSLGATSSNFHDNWATNLIGNGTSTGMLSQAGTNDVFDSNVIILGTSTDQSAGMWAESDAAGVVPATNITFSNNKIFANPAYTHIFSAVTDFSGAEISTATFTKNHYFGLPATDTAFTSYGVAKTWDQWRALTSPPAGVNYPDLDSTLNAQSGLSPGLGLSGGHRPPWWNRRR